MADYDNTNRGAIWPNRKKETEKHPDFTGSLNVEGKDYWVSAWKRKLEADDRAPSLSFSVKPKDGKEPPFRDKNTTGSDDSEIPF